MSTGSLDPDFAPRHLIAGHLVDGARHFPVIDPSTAEPFAACPDADEALLDRAVDAARAAQPDWAATSQTGRRARIVEFSARLVANSTSLARTITLEQGKPYAAALGEVKWAAEAMTTIAGIDIGSELLREDNRGRVELHHRPLGVIGAITPWNVPVGLAAPKIASALWTGNAVILKPSPYTPLSSLHMAQIAADVLPPGVFQVLAGGDALGRWMSVHPGIAKINFTGSVATGRRVMESAAATLKRLTLELGGNDAAILLDDVDVDAIAPRLFAGAFGLSGQVCMAIKRLYVPRGLLERTVEAMTALAASARVGGGFEDGVQIGPLQNRIQFDKVLELLADTRAVPGVRITTGGHALDRPGYFIAPTVVANIAEGTRLVDTEPFGPVLPILTYDTVDEAVSRANASEFGLGGSVWSPDTDRAAAVAVRLETGFTWVNHHVGTTRDLPFGGVKMSGLGRQGGAIGVHSDMEPQVVVIPAGE